MAKISSQGGQEPAAVRLQAIKNAHIDLLQRKDFEKYEQTMITLKGEEGSFPLVACLYSQKEEEGRGKGRVKLIWFISILDSGAAIQMWHEKSRLIKKLSFIMTSNYPSLWKFAKSYLEGKYLKASAFVTPTMKIENFL